jgi:flagellar basal-body rod protein FlgB
MELIPGTIDVMQKALDVRAAQQRVIASNLANIDTPGYVAQKVDFEASMRNALNDLDQPMVIEPSADAALSLDGNNVDLEHELGAMGENKTMYTLIAQMMGNKFRQMNTIFERTK